MTYPAIFHREKKTYWVEFPDLEGCLTQADSIDEAKIMAKEALTAYLESLDSRKINIPTPSVLEGKNIYYIEPDINVSFAITLKHVREQNGWTQKQAAKKIGINWTMYQRIENPRRSNPTLATIAKVELAFGRKLVAF